jgi:hypothetical protein
MNHIILPSSRRNSNALRDVLATRTARQFETQVALSDALSAATQRVARGRKMRFPEVLDGLVTALVSATQAGVPETEWSDVAQVLAETIQLRLTVTGVT